jgi:hypothetical protein
MPNFKVTIDVLDVAVGDIRSLVDDIIERHGESFDMGQGDFSISVSKDGFPVDLDEED